MGDRDAAIREELGRVLASDAFVSSPMLAAFLKFIVEETLAGREDRLKAYTIAVGALDRPETFDPNDNPVVRVQARRLRQALQRHYDTTAVAPKLRIDLPLGNYVPIFVETDEVTTPPPVTLVGPPPPMTLPARRTPVDAARLYGRGRLTVSVVLAALLGAGIGVGGWNLWHRLETTAPTNETDGPQTSRPAVTANEPKKVEYRGLDASRVLPLLRVDVDIRQPADGLDADIYRNRIETFARRFEDTVVLTRRSPDYPTPNGQPLYVLSFLLARDGISTNAYYQLVHAGDERILRSGAVSLGTVGRPMPSAADPLQTTGDLALVRDFVQLHGSISQDLANLADLSPELSCLARAWTYTRDTSPANHHDARVCLEAVVADNPHLAPAATWLGAIYLDEYDQSIDPLPGDAIARSEAMLRAAIRVAPGSSAAYQILQSLLLIEGDVGAAVQAGARAIALNPEDMNAVGSYGALLARVGRYEEAVALMRRVEANLSTPPRWMEFCAFLALNNLGRVDEADRRVAFFSDARSSVFLTAVAIRAHRRADDAAAAEAVAEIARREPDVATDPTAFLRRRGLTAPVIERFMVDLRAAGFAPAPH